MRILSNLTTIIPTISNARLVRHAQFWTWVLARTDIVYTIVVIPVYSSAPREWSAAVSSVTSQSMFAIQQVIYRGWMDKCNSKEAIWYRARLCILCIIWCYYHNFGRMKWARWLELCTSTVITIYASARKLVYNNTNCSDTSPADFIMKFP